MTEAEAISHLPSFALHSPAIFLPVQAKAREQSRWARSATVPAPRVSRSLLSTSENSSGRSVPGSRSSETSYAEERGWRRKPPCWRVDPGRICVSAEVTVKRTFSSDTIADGPGLCSSHDPWAGDGRGSRGSGEGAAERSRQHSKTHDVFIPVDLIRPPVPGPFVIRRSWLVWFCGVQEVPV
jgi:hypothetical protein